MNKRILIIEENGGDYQQLRHELLTIGYASENIFWHGSNNDIQSIAVDDIHLIFIAVAAPVDYYNNVIAEVQQKFVHASIIALCGTTCSEVTKKLNVQDCLVKADFDQKLLYRAIEYAVAKNLLQDKIKEVENIFESISDAFFAVDKDWNFTYINRQLEQIYASKGGKKLLTNLWENFTVAPQKFHTELHRAVREKVSVHFEQYFPTRDLWFAVNAYPIKDGLAVYLSDISEEKRLQEKISIEEKKLSAIINNTKDIIWAVDKTGNVTSANQAFYERTFKLTKKEYSESNDDDFGKEKVEKWAGYFMRALSGESYKIEEEDVVDNEIVYEEISFNPIRDHENNVIGVSCFSRDITEQKKHLLKIEAQNEKLKEIAWIQSHKVRGPVASILGLANLFNDDPCDPINKQILEGIKTAAINLDKIIREVVEKTIMPIE